MTPTIQNALKRQYHASLAMLNEAIEACPETLLNLRHLHHHTGQIAERLRHVANRGIEWVGGPEL
jgi:hypothetical protein